MSQPDRGGWVPNYGRHLYPFYVSGRSWIAPVRLAHPRWYVLWRIPRYFRLEWKARHELRRLVRQEQTLSYRKLWWFGSSRATREKVDWLTVVAFRGLWGRRMREHRLLFIQYTPRQVLPHHQHDRCKKGKGYQLHVEEGWITTCGRGRDYTWLAASRRR